MQGIQDVQKEYDRLQDSIVNFPKGRRLSYIPEMFLQIKAIQNTFRFVSEQQIIEEAISIYYKLLAGLSLDDAQEEIKRWLIPEQSFKRLQTCLNELRKINKKQYPELREIGDFDWEKQLEELELYLTMLRTCPEKSGLEITEEVEGVFDSYGFPETRKVVLPITDAKAEIALTKRQIQLVIEIIEITRSLSI